MSLTAGQEIELTVEKPVAGGRMLARHERQVVLVTGVIPGERVRARVERVDRQLAFAHPVHVIEPSSDRQPAGSDPACGGCTYAHVAYPRQLELKSLLIADAFGRLGRIPIDPPAVAASPARGYRMRARFHVSDSQIGFYRAGTHEICDARLTGHLTDAAVQAVIETVRLLAGGGCAVTTVLLSENVSGDERVLAVAAADADGGQQPLLEKVCTAAEVTGCTLRDARGIVTIAGEPSVGDPLEVITGGRAAAGVLRRRAESFFQANRFLLPQLVGTVVDAVPEGGVILDLYAGVGLFSVSLAAAGRTRITAVEGDLSSGHDLTRNATGLGVRVIVGSVETHLQRARRLRGGTVLVDPPRTGISKAAMQAVAALGARRIVYVSCDPATMARDARRLLDAGYTLASLTAFDLFPNTPHVETAAVFEA